MSNINCSESGCTFMEDGKCTLTVITPTTERKDNNSACPYYQEE